MRGCITAQCTEFSACVAATSQGRRAWGTLEGFPPVGKGVRVVRKRPTQQQRESTHQRHPEVPLICVEPDEGLQNLSSIHIRNGETAGLTTIPDMESSCRFS